jgi:MtN3 and saliva related transmembrane protein
MASADLIGWASSVLLVFTIGRQVLTQWQSGTSEGVSHFLFIGQAFASAGFTVYSWLIGSHVFVVTNSLMFLNALTGIAICRIHARRARSRSRPKRPLAPQRT